MERAEVDNVTMILAMAELAITILARTDNHVILTQDELLSVFGPHKGDRRFHIMLERASDSEVHLYLVPPDEPSRLPA
jgi:hypothetical protein